MPAGSPLPMNAKTVSLRRAILLLLGLLSLAVAAAPMETPLDARLLGADSVSLAGHYAILEDPSQRLSLAEVQSPDIAGRFVSGQGREDALNFGFTPSAYWLRLSLRNPLDHPIERMLEIRYPILSNVQVYRPQGSDSHRLLATGVATPFSTRPYPNRFFVFPLRLAANATEVIYLRVQSVNALLIPSTLWEPNAFHIHERNDYLVQSWYFGMVAAIILFNLLLFLALRDGVYLLYIVFATGTALTIAAGNGFGKEFLWPDTALWSDVAINACGSLTLAALLLLMRHMLNTREIAPRLDFLSKCFVGIMLLFPLGLAISPRAFVIFGTGVISVTGILILSVGIYCAYALRQKIAKLFVAAFSMWLLGVLLASLKTLSLLPANMVTMNGYQLGSTLEMLMLAFVLAYRFDMIRAKATEDVERANADLETRLQLREAELKENHRRLRDIEHRQILSQERQRLMQDMHDGMGSSLTSALRVVERGQLDKTDIAHVLKGCIDDLKLTIDAMEPVHNDLLLLLATLRFRLGPRLEQTGIRLLWEVNDLPPLDWLDPNRSLHILRILQEAFTNVLKHANATEIRVLTDCDGDGVTVTIADNGQGFAPDRARDGGGKGLPSQMRRAQAIGAELTWDSNDSGTRLSLRLPRTRQV